MPGEPAPDWAKHVLADLASFASTLRAYFAFKIGLPFGYSKWSRASAR